MHIRLCGNGNMVDVAEFHKRFIYIMEGGMEHIEDVYIERDETTPTYTGKCDCCNQQRVISKHWRVIIGDQRFTWHFGQICEGALIKVAALYNALKWIERPEEGENHRGFGILPYSLGAHSLHKHAPIQDKTKALSRLKKIIVNMAADPVKHYGKRQ
jgi:hypothetical protein